MSRFLALTAIGVTICVTGGCSTLSQGTKFNDAYVAQIQRGITTKADIQKNLGNPASTTSTSDGDVWTYQYSDGGSYLNMVKSTYGLASQQINSQLLTINFAGDTVKDFTYTQQKAE
jgi:hypothetical protein